MAIEFDPTEQWDRVAAELRAHKETQQQAWGDIDNATPGRYLAGDLSGDERQHIEQALTQLPELRKLTDIVRDVLDEFDPATPAPLAEAPKVVPFPQRRAVKPLFSRALRSRGTLLAACLLLGLGLTLVSMRAYTMIGQANRQVNIEQVSAERPNGLETYAPAVTPGNYRPPLLHVAAKVSPTKEKTMVEGWKQVGTSTTTMLAVTQEQLGDFYQENGDLDRAETFLVNARDLRRQALGERDPKTLQLSQKVAEVYERATQRQIQLIARRHQIALFAETVPNLADKDTKKALDRAKNKETNSITILICKEPPSVQVVVSETLRQQGFTPACQAELKKLAEKSLKQREFDQGLWQSVRYVTQHVEQAAQHRKVAAGAVLGDAGIAPLPR